MDAYEQLAAEAKRIRDDAFKSARADYQAAIRRINDLRRQLTGEAPTAKPVRDGSMSNRILELLPRERTFTATELITAMHADPIGKHFEANSIRSMLGNFKRSGIVRQVGRKNGHVLWASQAAKVTVSPFGGACLTDIAEQLLRELGPMRVPELVVAMRERGYRPDEKPNATAANVLRAITRFSGRFERGIDGRWTVMALRP